MRGIIMRKLIADEESTLYLYLRKNMKDKSKNNIKTLLAKGIILVNDNVVTNYDYLLQKNDVITFKNTKSNSLILNIIYEDDDIIVVNKPYGILTIANKKEKEHTLYREVSKYLKKENKKVFIIHRLDKDTSGIIMFAKNQKIQKLYQNNWNDLAKIREYSAVVEGVTDVKGHIESYLKQTKTLKVYSSKNKDGYFAITNYERVKNNNKFSLLKIHILTGRRNQIRCHMSDIGHPIVGDKRYHAKSNPINRLALHANKLVIINPLTKEIMTFSCPIPKEFDKLIN